MQFDLRAACTAERRRMEVPAVPLGAIRAAAARPPGIVPRKRSALSAVFLAAIPMLAMAAGAAQLWRTHIYLNPTGVSKLQGHNGAWAKNPTLAELRAFSARLNFPVILPVGLPEGTQPIRLVRMDTDALLIQYNLPGTWRRSDHLLDVIVSNPSTLESPPHGAPYKYNLMFGGHAGRGSVHWRIGKEEVIVFDSTMTTLETAHFKRAMQAAAAGTH